MVDEIHQVLVLSTAHVTKETAARIDDETYECVLDFLHVATGIENAWYRGNEYMVQESHQRKGLWHAYFNRHYIAKNLDSKADAIAACYEHAKKHRGEPGYRKSPGGDLMAGVRYKISR